MDPRTFRILGVDLRNRFVDLHGDVKSLASGNEKSARCGRSLGNQGRALGDTHKPEAGRSLGTTTKLN